MFRRTATADCTRCRRRDWELHCPQVRCGWYVCRHCGVIYDPHRSCSYDPSMEQEFR